MLNSWRKLSRSNPYALYCLSNNNNKDIVDAMIKIMDDGPRPMRNMKPSQKQPTGADHFWADHQAEYETRGKQSGDKIARVHHHNAAYPKMRDELNKRRSINKVTAIKRHTTHHKRTTNSKLRLKRLKLNPSRRYQRHRPREKTRRRRIKSPCEMYKLIRIKEDRAIQCVHSPLRERERVQTLHKSVLTNSKDEISVRNSVNMFRKSERNLSKSDVISNNPDTSEQSINSYHSSDLYVDQEPMVRL